MVQILRGVHPPLIDQSTNNPRVEEQPPLPLRQVPMEQHTMFDYVMPNL